MKTATTFFFALFLLMGCAEVTTQSSSTNASGLTEIEKFVEGYIGRDAFNRFQCKNRLYVNGQWNGDLLLKVLKEGNPQAVSGVFQLLIDLPEIEAQIRHTTTWDLIKEATLSSSHLKSLRIHAHAVRAFKLFADDKRFAPALLEALKAEEAEVILAAISSLGPYREYIRHSPETLDRLIVLAVDEKRPAIQFEATCLLLGFTATLESRTPQKSIPQELIESLNSRNQDKVLQAIKELDVHRKLMLGSHEVMSRLGVLAKDQSRPAVQLAATKLITHSVVVIVDGKPRFKWNGE